MEASRPEPTLVEWLRTLLVIAVALGAVYWANEGRMFRPRKGKFWRYFVKEQ